MNSHPLTGQEFADTMAALSLPAMPEVAVAVSGGADSMALCLLAKAWADERGITLHALTVDHGLRETAACEAKQVGTWLKEHGISHHILIWQPDASRANLQARARDARYELMADWCKTHGITNLLLAHHLDDQAETFLIRLGRGSGVDGLSAMRTVSQRLGITLLRPLLSISKSRLVTFLTATGQDWIEDPSNHATQFTRTRMRHLLPQLAEAGISAEELGRTAKRMARAQSFLRQSTEEAYAATLSNTASGLTLNREAFRALHPEIGLRVLAAALQNISGDIYRPRFDQLESLYDALCEPGSPVARSLSGVEFRSGKSGFISITYAKIATLKAAS